VLSPEARAAAFLPLKIDGAAASVGAAARPAAAATARIAGNPREPAAVDAGGRERARAGAARRSARLRELGIVRPPRLPPRPKPTVLGGLSGRFIAGVVLVALVVGAGAGVMLASRDRARNPAPMTARTRAESQLVDGNRAYDAAVQLAARGDAASAQAAQARFGDAVGYYKAAINIDRTFALAHRAKGAALAKQQRWDEAAAAYRDYLDIERDAVDAADVRESLARRGVVGDGRPPQGAGGG
jgi:tetratricopeptide (TPR) repeat protein